MSVKLKSRLLGSRTPSGLLTIKHKQTRMTEHFSRLHVFAVNAETGRNEGCVVGVGCGG